MIKGRKYGMDGLFIRTSNWETDYTKDRERGESFAAGFYDFPDVSQYKCGHNKNYPAICRQYPCDDCMVCKLKVAHQKAKWKCKICKTKFNSEKGAYIITLVDLDAQERAEERGRDVKRIEHSVCEDCLFGIKKYTGSFKWLKLENVTNAGKTAMKPKSSD